LRCPAADERPAKKCNVEQRCADCQRGRTLPEIRAKESVYALNEPGSSNSTISVTTGHFHGYHFFHEFARLSFRAVD